MSRSSRFLPDPGGAGGGEERPATPVPAGQTVAAWTTSLSDADLVAELRANAAAIAARHARQVEIVAALTERDVFDPDPQTSARQRRRDRDAAVALGRAGHCDPTVDPDAPGGLDDLADVEQARWAAAAAEVSCALTIAPVTAATLVGISRDLTDRLPATLTALRVGQITWAAAKLIADLTAVLPSAKRTEVEGKALRVAPRLTCGKLAKKLTQWVLEADPAGAADRHQHARRQRLVRITPAPDGMADLRAHLPADGAQAVSAAIDAVARTLQEQDRAAVATDTGVVSGSAVSASTANGGGRDDDRAPGAPHRRRADQARADALVTICRTVLDTGHTGCGSATCDESCWAGTATTPTACSDADSARGAGGSGDTDTDGRGTAAGRRRPPPKTPVRLARRHGRRPHIQVTVAATTLMRLDELPGWLTGYGPITADHARAIAAEGSWTRLLTDPDDGRLLSYGRTRRDPPQDLVDHVIARDRTCRFPTSNIPAHRCDLDHREPWERGGHTDPDNLHALAPGLHQVRHAARWQVTDLGRGRLRWTSPTGHTYLTDPEQLGPIASAQPEPTATDSPDGDADDVPPF